MPHRPHRSPPPEGARFAPIPAACAWSGLGRTRLYELARSGEVVIRKAGRRSLVDLASLAQFLESRPRLGG
jgi:hypothetical protein